jgi:hypothetical protein
LAEQEWCVAEVTDGGEEEEEWRAAKLASRGEKHRCTMGL